MGRVKWKRMSIPTMVRSRPLVTPHLPRRRAGTSGFSVSGCVATLETSVM